MTYRKQFFLSVIVLVATAMSAIVLSTGGAVLPNFVTQPFTQLASPVSLTSASFFDDYDTLDFLEKGSFVGVRWNGRSEIVFDSSRVGVVGSFNSKRFYTGPVTEMTVNLSTGKTGNSNISLSSDAGLTWCRVISSGTVKRSDPNYSECLKGETFQYRVELNSSDSVGQIIIFWRPQISDTNNLSTSFLPTIASLKKKFDAYYAERYPNGIAWTLNSSYFSEGHLAGLISMYEATQEKLYLEEALKGVEHLVSLLRDGDGDGYLEWLEGVAMGITLQNHDSNPATPRRYSCLDTERGVRQFARLARIIKNDAVLDVAYGQRATAIVRIIEHDIINNPYCRDRYTPAVNTNGTVYHIVSHAALILNELYLATGNRDYLNIATVKAQALKNNFKSQPDDSQAVAWGTTACLELNYSYPACYYVKTTNPAHPVCKDSVGHRYCSPSDVSHAENFIFTAIELYRSGVVFTKNDINALAHTFLAKVWDGNLTSPRFRDFIDGNLEPADAINEGGYGQWEMGRGTSPGWVGLGAFNNEISRVLFAGDGSDVTNKDNQPLAFYGELARNLVVKDCQYTNRAQEIADGLDNDCDGIIDEGVAPLLAGDDIPQLPVNLPNPLPNPPSGGSSGGSSSGSSGGGSSYSQGLSRQLISTTSATSTETSDPRYPLLLEIRRLLIILLERLIAISQTARQ